MLLVRAVCNLVRNRQVWRIIYKAEREYPACACWVAVTSTYAMVVGHVCLCKNVCMKETCAGFGAFLDDAELKVVELQSREVVSVPPAVGKYVLGSSRDIGERVVTVSSAQGYQPLYERLECRARVVGSAH